MEDDNDLNVLIGKNYLKTQLRLPGMLPFIMTLFRYKVNLNFTFNTL